MHLRIEIPFVDTSVSGYLKKNKQGRINDGYDFNSNGHGYIRICQRLNYFWNESAWIENNNYIKPKLQGYTVEDIISTPITELQIDMKIFVPTVKLAVKYSAHKYLRRAWKGLWSSKIEYGAEGEIPQSVLLIKYFWRKGVNMLRYCAPELVCSVSFVVLYLSLFLLLLICNVI